MMVGPVNSRNCGILPKMRTQAYRRLLSHLLWLLKIQVSSFHMPVDDTRIYLSSLHIFFLIDGQTCLEFELIISLYNVKILTSTCHSF